MKVLAVVGVIAAAALWAAPGMAQERRAAFRSGVEVVPITAVVRDARNEIVKNLTREDVEVLEDGVPRPIVAFSSTERASVTLGLLFDTSGSMRGRTLETGRLVVDTLLHALDRDADEVSLFTFDKTVHQQTPFTSDREVIRCALDEIRTWGLTSLYDGVADTARRVRDRPSERRAVVVITDGLDTSSTMTAPEVSGLASAIEVPVYVIAVVPPSRSTSGASQTARDYHLANLAYWTGGDVVHVTDASAAAKAMDRLMAELRQQYAITIEAAPESGWHRLEVRTKRRGLSVRARIGYHATPAAPARSD